MRRNIIKTVAIFGGILAMAVLCGFIYKTILFGIVRAILESPRERNIEKIDIELEKELEEKYNFYLPAKYEYIDGYKSTFTLDPYTNLHFEVSKKDFETLLGEGWKIEESNEKKDRIKYLNEYVEVEGKHFKYEKAMYVRLYYNIKDDTVECYLCIVW